MLLERGLSSWVQAQDAMAIRGGTDMHVFSRMIVLVLFVLLGSIGARAENQDFLITLLGTASPRPQPDRFGPSTLVRVGDQTLLFDAGRGVPIRMVQLKIPLGKIDALFLTHYHSDHTLGLPDIWLSGWLPPAFGQRKGPLNIIGPTGAKALVSGLQQAYADDIKIREADEKLSPEAIALNVEEFDRDGVVYEKDGVRVTAFEVNHGEFIKPAYGYRIDYRNHSVVISGDTQLNENVIKYGTGADVLIHEVCASDPKLLEVPAFKRIAAHHTSPHDAGTVFARAHPKMAVYTHIVRLSSPTIPQPSLADIVAETRETYQGPLVVGEDLLTFGIGAAGVAIYRGGS
jgi:ribonuclease Z